VRRAGKGNGVSLTVDGKPIDGAVVPPPPAGVTEVAVEVKLG
jgi:cellobiose phosphorylase